MPLILQVVCAVCRRSPRMMNAAKNILIGLLNETDFPLRVNTSSHVVLPLSSQAPSNAASKAWH